jgi:hypothetical protein
VLLNDEDIATYLGAVFNPTLRRDKAVRSRKGRQLVSAKVRLMRIGGDSKI